MKEDSSLLKKIYLICYSQPRYREEIKSLLYGENISSYSYADGLINEMLKEKAGFPLKKCTKKDVRGKRIHLESNELTAPYEKIVTDGRATRGDFLISNVEPILQKIKSEIIEMKRTPALSPEEEKTLVSMLKDNRFRESFEVSFSKIDFQHQDVDPEFFIIYSLCSTAGLYYGMKKKFGNNLNKVLQMMNTLKTFDTEARKIIKKEGNFQESLSLADMDTDSVLKLKKLGFVFNKANQNLLWKITNISPEARINASLLLSAFSLR